MCINLEQNDFTKFFLKLRNKLPMNNADEIELLEDIISNAVLSVTYSEIPLPETTKESRTSTTEQHQHH